MGPEEHPRKNADVRISSYRYTSAKPEVQLNIKLKKKGLVCAIFLSDTARAAWALRILPDS